MPLPKRSVHFRALAALRERQKTVDSFEKVGRGNHGRLFQQNRPIAVILTFTHLQVIQLQS
mgnify:CR=1 FL=1